MNTDLLKRVRGPAVAFHKAQAWYTKTSSALETVLDPFSIPSDAHGSLGQRHNNRILSTTFQPVGVWSDAHLAVLFPFLNYRFGQYNTPMLTITGINTTTDQLTVPDHGIVAGTGFRVGKGRQSSTMPTGITENQLYFIGVVDADHVTLHASEAAAVAGTGKVDITVAGSGVIRMIQNSPLIIHTLDGIKLTVHNAGCVQMPDIKATAGDTLFGQTKYEGYGIHGSDWEDPNSLYTVVEEALVLPALDTADILTVPYTVDFDGIFAGLQVRDAIDIKFPTKQDPVPSDAHGVNCRSVQMVESQVEFVPTNLDAIDLLNEMGLQGTGAGRGKPIPTANLNIYGPDQNPYMRLYGAALSNTPLKFGSNADRVDKMTFKSQRTQADVGANPIAYLGTESPD